eukprot:3823954-Ditylum_brightwellii.AAC.1
MDEKALLDMMRHVDKRSREVCAPVLAAMKQRQEVFEQKLAGKIMLMDTSKDMGNEELEAFIMTAIYIQERSMIVMKT